MGWGKRWKAYSNDLGHLLLFLIVNPLRVGAFSRDFITNLAPQCRALKIEKLKALYSGAPRGPGIQMTDA